ncbi:MAG TPA: hypothetical protein VIH52_02910 [Candidatus Nanoarchaeia archaeon]|nr:hypothetical protein [uncultured archaeon]
MLVVISKETAPHGITTATLMAEEILEKRKREIKSTANPNWSQISRLDRQAQELRWALGQLVQGILEVARTEHPDVTIEFDRNESGVWVLSVNTATPLENLWEAICAIGSEVQEKFKTLDLLLVPKTPNQLSFSWT